MRGLSELQVSDGEVYLAGQRVPAGHYSQIGDCREVCLDTEDILPASLDGRVACYERLTNTWAQHQKKAQLLLTADSVRQQSPQEILAVR